ncbi:hypothetical protein RERY_51100 [Rhodococcus erythropolis]|nr:hypothetical protein RERY_51100 [Rhodococcus erythropolis]
MLVELCPTRAVPADRVASKIGIVLAPEGYTEASLGLSLVGVGINGGSGRELRDPDIRDTQSWAMSLFAAGKHMLDR